MLLASWFLASDLTFKLVFLVLTTPGAGDLGETLALSCTPLAGEL